MAYGDTILFCLHYTYHHLPRVLSSMPQCLNDPSTRYTGTELSPLGLGISPCTEAVGTVHVGKQPHTFWVVTQSGNRKRWVRMAASPQQRSKKRAVTNQRSRPATKKQRTTRAPSSASSFSRGRASSSQSDAVAMLDTYAAKRLGQGVGIIDDCACVLNQTNLGANHNKFYIMQALRTASGDCYVFTRWGRVGLVGQMACKPARDAGSARRHFEKVFLTKTGNHWATARRSFVPQPKKYDLVHTVGPSMTRRRTSSVRPHVPTRMDKETFDLVRWILDADMFKHAMQSYQVDLKKCPLGAISKKQVSKGFAILEDIDGLVRHIAGAPTHAQRQQLEALSSRFYTVIPHACGMRAPPVIVNETLLNNKFDLVTMLGDIHIAQTLQTTGGSTSLHPVDRQYAQLGATLSPVARTSKLHATIQQYFNATKRGGSNTPSRMSQNTKTGTQLLQLWEVKRHGEAQRFHHLFGSVGNRRLLWHGTNVAVAAAILKTGLRIMPTATTGSRVGRGIYLASEAAKSEMYCRTARVGKQRHGLLFLCEAPLGRAHYIHRDDWTLTKAPQGFDSVIAQGRQEPNARMDTTLDLDGHDVTVAQAGPVPTRVSSHFDQSEYLVYREAQCCIRFVARCQF